MDATLKSRAVRWAAVAAVLALLLWLLAPVLTPFVVAALLAYVLHAPVCSLHRRGVPRLLAVVLVELVALVAVAGLLLLIVPVLVHEVPLIKEQVPRLAQRINESLAPFLQRWGISFSLDVEAIKDVVRRFFDDKAEDIFSAALNSLRIGGSVLLAVIGNAVLVPVALYYLLADAPRLSAWAASLIPPRLAPSVGSFAAECDDLLGHYLRGQVLVMLVLALYYCVALALLGFDLALPVGLFTGLAVAVPYLGFGLGLLLALLSGILQFGPGSGLLMVALVYGVGQLLESFVLTPRLVGERIGLSPLAVIFSLLAFGQLLGFVGVLLALPASAVLLVMLRRLQAAYLASSLYRG